MEIEHVKPKSRGGSNRISNLVMACHPCNETKDSLSVEVFLAGKPDVLRRIQTQIKAPLKDAAAMNATRYAIGNRLKASGFPVSFWSGGRTKFNRTSQNYPKVHWIDAACVGDAGKKVSLNPDMPVLNIKACGHGSRQMCRMDKFGFPRTAAKGLRVIKGFRSGDIVKAVVPVGKKTGTHTGRAAVRSSGSFNIATEHGTIQGIGHKHCQILRHSDGYNYSILKKETALLPMAKARGIRAAVN